MERRGDRCDNRPGACEDFGQDGKEAGRGHDVSRARYSGDCGGRSQCDGVNGATHVHLSAEERAAHSLIGAPREPIVAANGSGWMQEEEFVS